MDNDFTSSGATGKMPDFNTLPPINFCYIKKLTTDLGIQHFFSSHETKEVRYTLDDNACALIAVCRQYALSKEEEHLNLIYTYFNFVKHCLQPEGYFLNYTDSKGTFTGQNNSVNLADANGRAIWALGYLASKHEIVPTQLIIESGWMLKKVLPRISSLHSTRAIAFIIKGLFYYNIKNQSAEITAIIKALANKLVQMYHLSSEKGWKWYEKYLTYANGLLPDAMLCAYQATGEANYKDIAKESFDFLLAYMLTAEGEKNVIEQETGKYGEYPMNNAHTILALGRFYDVFNCSSYMLEMKRNFNWFLGDNRLQRIIYDSQTGGCCNGLQDTPDNYQQGTGATLGYLMARLTLEKHVNEPGARLLSGNFARRKEFLSGTGTGHEEKQVA